VILVQYDGLTKLSEVTIESILLWIRIYDIPVSMMTKAFVTVLVSGILPGYSCKEGGRVEDGLLLEFPCTPTRTRSV
jgi:hypothetical protein